MRCSFFRSINRAFHEKLIRVKGMISFGLPSTEEVTTVRMIRCFHSTVAISMRTAMATYHEHALILNVLVRVQLWIVGSGPMQMELLAETLEIYEDSKMSGKQMEAGMLYIGVLRQKKKSVEKGEASFVTQLYRK